MEIHDRSPTHICEGFQPFPIHLTCLLNVATFGLFTLLINAVLFWLTGLIGSYLRVGFTAEWWSALIGALVVSIVSAILSLFLKDELKGKKKDN